jgi:VanZ family protein
LDQSCATDWGLPNPSARIDFGWDKLNHRLAFAALAFSAHMGHPAPRHKRLIWFCALLVFGGLIEILLQFVPGRSSDCGDVFADALGIVCGALFAEPLRCARPSDPVALRQHLLQPLHDEKRLLELLALEVRQLVQ